MPMSSRCLESIFVLYALKDTIVTAIKVLPLEEAGRNVPLRNCNILQLLSFIPK